MGVYSVMLPDSKIMKGVASCKSVVIVGCGACASDSLAYDNDYPLCKLEVDSETGQAREIPVPVAEEMKRIKQLLESQGISVSTEVYFGLCLLSYDKEGEMAELLKRCSGADAVITLSCPGGTLGLKRGLKGDAKIVPAMKTVGVFQIRRVLDESKQFVVMDKSQSKTIPILKQ